MNLRSETVIRNACNMDAGKKVLRNCQHLGCCEREQTLHGNGVREIFLMAEGKSRVSIRYKDQRLSWWQKAIMSRQTLGMMACQHICAWSVLPPQTCSRLFPTPHSKRTEFYHPDFINHTPQDIYSCFKWEHFSLSHTEKPTEPTGKHDAYPALA
jgi:hypothetical protein